MKFLKGWFKDTLPGAPIKALALLRLDGDMYESTVNALANPYPKVGMLLTPHRIFSAVGLIIFILIFTKLGLAHNLGIWLLLPVLVAGYVLLCVISVPVAVAFFITSIQLIAQASMAHPGVSVFGILSVVVLAALLIIRWREGLLAEFSRLRWPLLLPSILLAIVFAIGFFGAVQSPDTVTTLHYVFLSHWLVYIALGILACARLAELKIFLIAFSLLHVVTIFPLPMDFYPYFLEKIYYECVPMGLHSMDGWERLGTRFGSVNRSHVGYLAAMASLISLSLAHHQGGRLRNMFYLWSLLAVVVLFLAGSKGPVLGWVIGVFIVMRFADKQEWVKSLLAVGVIASAIGVSALMGYSPVPCGTVKLYTADVQRSYDTRVDLLQGVLNRASDDKRVSLNEGAVETYSRDLSAKIAPEQWLHVLLGDGFGTAARRIGPDTGSTLAHYLEQTLAEAGSHNLFIDLLVDTGWVGLVLFLLALSILIIGFVRPLLRHDFPDRRLVMAAMGSTGMVVLIMLLLTTSTYREYLGAFLIGLLMGSAVYMSQRHPPFPDASHSASNTTGES